jgi:hypothetical protein
MLRRDHFVGDLCFSIERLNGIPSSRPSRLPLVAGTLGLSFVAAFQTSSFPKVEGRSYGSVMATSNSRYTIEGLFTAFAGMFGHAVSPAHSARCASHSEPPSVWS